MDLRAHHKPTFDNISAEKRSRILDAATNEFAVKGFENGNIQAVMDGDIDGFIFAYLKAASRGELQDT